MEEMKVDTRSRKVGNSHIEKFPQQEVHHLGGVTSNFLSDLYSICVTVRTIAGKHARAQVLSVLYIMHCGLTPIRVEKN